MRIESEKLLESKLRKEFRKIGGLCIKLSALNFAGIPDRLCLFPGGRVLFVEVKTTKEKPRKLQNAIHTKIRTLGFRVDIVDKSEQIEEILKDYERSI